MPVITAPSAGDTLTTNTPTVTLTAEPNSTVSLYLDGGWIDDIQVDAQGTASYTFTRWIYDGQHTLTATETDALGDTSDPSPGVTFAVDTQPSTPQQPEPPTPPITTPPITTPPVTNQPHQPKPPTVTAPVPPGGSVTVRPGKHTQVNLQVSAPGTVTVTIERHVGGRWVPAGTETLTATQAGPLPVALGTSFGGRISPPAATGWPCRRTRTARARPWPSGH